MASGLWAALCGPASGAGVNATLLLSRPSGLGALPGPGDGVTSLAPKAISADGRMIVFASGADDLGVSDTLVHVWVRDTLAGTTTLVDRVPGEGTPGDGVADTAAISADGATVCFVGNATNLVAGVNGIHVFVVTLSSGAIAVADRAGGAAGAVGNEAALRCALDAVGTRVVFDSRASNLVPGDTNAAVDVFVRDLGAGSTTRVSVSATGTQAPNGGQGGAISADGLSVAFDSPDALVAGETVDFRDVYVRNLQAGTLVRVSVGTGGVEANAHSFGAALDDTGGHVAFVSGATNLDPAVVDTNNSLDVFWRDLSGSDTTMAVSRATGAGGALGDEDSEAPAISGDGLGVGFESAATNLGEGPPPGRWVYLRRVGTNETLLLSRANGAAGAPADGASSAVSLGATATVAAWFSRGSNLDAAASGEFGAAFRRDLSGAPVTTLVSRPSGTGPRSAALNDSFLGPRAASADGRLVVFESLADGIDPTAAGRRRHVFVRDVATNLTTLVSRGPGFAGAVANGDSFLPAISAGGTHVVFASRATNLLAGVTTPQVYVRDLATGDLEVASRAPGPNGAPAAGVRDDEAPDVSTDGRRVAFVVDDTLVATDTNMRRDVYVRDLAAGTTTLASVGAGGTSADHESRSPSLSDDGVRVAFASRASNLLVGPPLPGSRFHVYVRDLAAGTTVLADRAAAEGVPGTGQASLPEISGAGNRVAFAADRALTPEDIPPAGALYVRDLATDTTLLAGRGDGPAGAVVAPLGAFSVSRDGTRVSFSALGPGLPGAPEAAQVWVRDVAADTTTLASAADGTAATLADAAALGNALSAAGGCVAFDSRAANLTTPGYPTRDFSQAHLRAMTPDCSAPPTTTTTLPPATGTPVAARTVVVRPGRLAKLVARAPAAIAADPTLGGGTLVLRGTTGSASYALPATGWKAVGRRAHGKFRFAGAGCRVTLRGRRIKAVCRGDTGGLRLPEPGPVDVVLTVGAEGATYCAECGGTTAGKAARVFKRRRCAAPATCP
jgi:Tol biopolymer transport system component